ncbi:hypothetical protein AKJ16_DCAP08453 [Drosera capensis]
MAAYAAPLLLEGCHLVDGIAALSNSMITAGLELQNSLNSWKKVSKVRNTARRPASKMLKLGQQPGNGSSPKRVEAPEVPEHAKPQKVVSRHRSSSSIEHVPIKKRRYILRSPSPPSISPSQPIESMELYDGLNDSDRQTSLDSLAERENVKFGTSIAEGAVDSGVDMKSSSGKHSHDEDFSAITMLADAACSNFLDNSAADVAGKSAGVEVLMKEQGESYSVADRSEPTGSLELTGSLLKAHDDSVVPVLGRSEAIESFATSDLFPTEDHKMNGSVASISNDSSEPNDSGKTAEETTRSSSGSQSRDERFHWDLNVPVDEWNDPEDNQTTLSGLNVVDSTSFSCLENQNSENVGCSDLRDRSLEMETSKESAVLPSLCEPTISEMPSIVSPTTAISNPVEHGSEISVSGMNFISCPARIQAPDISDIVDLKVPVQTDGMVSGISSTFHLHSDDLMAQVPATSQKQEACSEPPNEGSDSIMDIAETEKLSVEAVADPNFACKQGEPFSTLVEKCEIPIFHGSESLGASTEPIAALPTDNVDQERKSILNNSMSELGKVSYETADSFPTVGETTAHKTEPASPSVCKSEESSLRVVAAQSVAPAGDGEVKEIADSTPVVNMSNIPLLERHAADEAFPDGVGIRAMNELCTEDLLDGGFNSHISHDHTRAGNGNSIEGGYDSHLEDGELREPMGLLWEENEADEAERLDYDSDTRDGYETDAYTDPVLSLGRTSATVDDEQTRSLPKQCSMKDDQLAMDMSTSHNRCRSIGSLSVADTIESEQLKREVVESRLTAGRKTGVGSNGFTLGVIDASEKAENTSTEVVGATESKRELISYNEGPCSSDRKVVDSIRRSRSNTLTSKHDEDERMTGSDDTMSKGRSPVHLEGRDRLGIRSLNYGLKSTVANSTDADGNRIMRSPGDSALGVRRTTTISTSTGGYSRLVRNGLESGNEDDYGRGKVRLHGVSPDDGIRGRFDRYSGINSRRYREGYRRQGMYENSDSAGAMRNHFSRRERSFSPICNRVDHLPQGHRRSRSRSRSRSTDFRPEARPGRMRVPYPSNNHITVHVRDRRSPPARVFIQGQRFERASSPGRLRAENCVRPIMRPVRFSDASTARRYEYEGENEFYRKPHSSRSQKRSRSRSRTRSPEFRSEAMMGPVRVSYQSRTTNHTRDRRSPVRVFRPPQRYDTSASPGRMRGEDHVRPVMRPARFSDASHSGRVNEYEDDEFRRKPRKIFGRGDQIRNFEMDDEVRRFQYDAEDDNVQQNFHNTERRSGDMLRNNREERGSTRYNSDRMY